MALTEKQLWILGGSASIIGLALILQRNRTFKQVLWPPAGSSKIYQPITHHSQLHSLALSNRRLLLNFTYRGEPRCNEVTKTLYELIDTKPFSMVDVESDFDGNRQLMLDYAVKDIPTLVMLEKQLPNRYDGPLTREAIDEWLSKFE